MVKSDALLSAQDAIKASTASGDVKAVAADPDEIRSMQERRNREISTDKRFFFMMFPSFKDHWQG